EMEFIDEMRFISGFYANLSDPDTVAAILDYEAPSQLQAMINDGIITENADGKIATSFDTAEVTTTPDTLVVKLIEDYSADDYTFVYTAVYTYSDFGNAKPEISADAKSHAADAKEFHEYMQKAEMIGDLMGEYIDSVSGRATLMVVQGMSSDLVMEVAWADSAFETYYWRMSCDIDVNNLTLNYTDCESYVVKVDANGNETSKTIYNDGKGYFSLYGDVIKWNGAEEPSCQNCEFVLM
ncbi:MAG: hypothetical protein MJ150_02640, partial [Clostridia bacterium]|nr:hypothetical protein [Clostridia bacterium]